MGNVRSVRDIDTALCKKGFRRTMHGKHIQYFFKDAPKIRTMVSHGMGNSSLSADLISRMARQLHLTKAQFLNLIDCTLSEEGYREVLKTQGLVA